MIQKLTKSFKDLFKESDEERTVREAKERHIYKQQKILQGLKCPVCGGQTLNNGYVSTRGAYGGSVGEISVYHSPCNTKYLALAKICDDCGYVLLFADFNTEYKRN